MSLRDLPTSQWSEAAASPIDPASLYCIFEQTWAVLWCTAVRMPGRGNATPRGPTAWRGEGQLRPGQLNGSSTSPWAGGYPGEEREKGRHQGNPGAWVQVLGESTSFALSGG